MEVSRDGMYGLGYHLVPPYGLMNDPNGLAYYKGQYHVFFQWNPTDTKHANKHWGHLVSDDMAHWKRLPVALAPDSWFDKSGVYSGSALVNGDELWLFYTGNVKDEEGNASSYQCLAVSSDGITFEKKGPIFEHPAGFTRHVRDPKVWYDERVNHYWLVVGAQHDEMIGDTLVYQSQDLLDWKLCGSINPAPVSLGYMWECPDVVHLGDKDVFIFSPQGVPSEGERFNNLYQTVYQLGRFNQEGQFEPDDPETVTELDAGFDFYAPQTFTDPDGRVLLYGWMGIPEGKEMQIPTIPEGWIHALTIPRELSVKDGILIQKPIYELERLRQNVFHIQWGQAQFETIFASRKQEWSVQWKSPVEGILALSLLDEIEIRYEEETQQLTVSRTDWKTEQRENRIRTLQHPLTSLKGYLDGSSLEVFVNGGEEVFSMRFFDKGESLAFTIQQSLEQTMTIEIASINADDFIVE